MFQAASLWAVVPRDCCAAHRFAASRRASCHEAAAATPCPIHGAEGMPCRMHHAGTGADDQATGNCGLRGPCDGPMASLVALLSNHGVLTDAVTIGPDPDARFVAPPARERLIARLAPPDSPPPRS